MVKVTYNRNGETVTKEFEVYRDLIEAVILENIQDEELVSIDLGDGEITGGINGLKDHTLHVINEQKEAEAALQAEIEAWLEEHPGCTEEDYWNSEDDFACEDCEEA